MNQAAAGSTQNGQTWATAFTKLEDAIAAAHPTASQMVEIWVAKGTYKPTSGTDRTAAFHLKSHLIIRGGFRGNEAGTSERTPWGNPTVLSGDIGTPMVGAITALNPSPSQLPSTTDAGWADNCYNVLVGDGVEDVMLEFLTITGGSATDTAIDAVDIDGFEMYSGNSEEDGAKSNVKPTSTVVGGGLFFTTGETWSVAQYGLQMYDCTFARNRARGYGGAVGIYDASAFIGGCSFERNVSSGPAGAVWGLNQQSGFVQCSFDDNTSGDGGGAVKIMGIPSDRSNDSSVDGFKDTLRGIAFSIFGVTEEQTQQNVGYVLTSYGIYKAANKFAAAEGGFFSKAAATVPNPFAKSTTNVGGSVVENTNISPASRVLAVYALVQIAVGVGDNIVKILDAFGKIDHNDQNYKNWVSFNTYFNKYATPQGLISVAAHAIIDAALPGVQPDLISAKKKGYTYYTQAGRSGFASCTFTGNKADNEGGAIELIFNNLLVENCRFEKNSATSNGGAISSALWNMPQVISSVFSGNTSANGTSAIANNFNSLMMVINCTIINNRSSDKLGKAVTAAMGADVRIYNSILWGNANASAQSGADVEAVTEDMLDENAHKRYDALDGERVNWLGYMDIRNSIVQSLASLKLGKDSIAPQLAGAYLTNDQINAAIAAAKEADARGELESTGAVNVGAGIREKVRDPAWGNSAQDPLLLASPVGRPSRQSPANNAGNTQWITWKMINHAVALANIMDVAGGKRVLNSQVDIGAYEVDNTLPDPDTLASQTVNGTGSSVSGGYTVPVGSGVGAGSAPTIGSAPASSTTVYYVKPMAAGDGSGSSWANATSSLQGAISHANAEVWVAAGTYKPTAGSDRTAAFSLADGVKVFGGFTGSETTRSARNWKANATVISGDIGTPNDASDNSKNLFRNTDVTSSAVLDGFTLRDASSSDADGGAILNTNSAPLIQNCVFQSNHARNGGAIYSSGVEAAGSALVNCQFLGNSADAAGGAVRYAQSLLGNNLVFSGNSAGTGGAISVSGGDANQYCTIQNGLFAGNSSTAGSGGAISSTGLYLNVLNSTFYGNTAAVTSSQKAGGGAIAHAFSTTGDTASAVILNSIFYKNTATNLGAGGLATTEKQQIQTTDNLYLSHSLVQGLSAYKGGDLQANFGGDPEFVAEGSDFHLKATSLAIDSGDGTSIYVLPIATDLDGNLRTINGAPDLGPYEHSATAAHPVKAVTESANGADSYTFTADYTAATGDTVRWYVDRGDGNGYVPLTEDSENIGVTTGTLTVLSPPNGFSYVLRVVHNGTVYYSPATTLEPTPVSLGKYVFVKPVATGDGSGSSWANATSNLQGAISREGGPEVWVAAGTYKPTAGTDRDATFSLASGVKVYGGFVGTETTLDKRDWRANPTIISGEIGGAGATDNSRHLLTNTDVGNNTTLDGFYFEDAYADGSDGGAILNVNSNPAIQNCVFESNHARNGGAIASTGTGVVGFGSTVFNCEFRENSAETAGGAIYFDGSWFGSNLLFKDNTAPAGGAVYSTGDADGQNFTVQNALFAGNLATAGPGGAILASGLSLRVVNSTFYGNQATVNSASAAAGGAVSFDRAASTTATLGIYNSILYKNTALNSGAGGRDTTEKQQIAVSAGSTASVKYSLIQGLQVFTGDSNFDANPLFVNEGSDFHLSDTSLAIDYGSTDDISAHLETTDLDGNDRVVNGTIDLGPYEHEATAGNPLKKITAAIVGLENYKFTASEYSAQAGDALQWYVDRGDGSGFVVLGANDPGQDALPDEYLGVNTASLSVLSPPSGFLFRLRLVRGGVTYYSSVSRLSPNPASKSVYIYVRPTATGDGSGSGWANATSDLKAAISQPYVQVWVQEGTYYATSGTDRDASFSLATGVQVYGGFRGTESLRDARNPAGHPTRISGNIGSPSDAHDNSRHLFKNENVEASTTLDGFTLEDAYADGEDGGAVLNISASPTFQNCVFQNNYARNGGAIASTGTPAFLFASNLVDCTFRDNTAELLGGAITCSSSLSITNVVFDGNTAGAGGAINLDGNSAGESFTVKNGLFFGNRALSGQGGAIFSKGLSMWVANSTFYGNRATLSSADPLGGGAIYQDYTTYSAYTVVVYSSIFYGNTAVNSGSGGLASLEYQQIAVKGGGIIYADHALIQGLNRYANVASLGNFDEDPQFVNAGGENFHLSNVSPAINAGSTSSDSQFLLPDTDLDGNTRVLLNVVDVGAYEYNGPATLGRITSTSDFSSGSFRFFKTAGFDVQPGDALRWYVDRGDGNGYVLLTADEVYSGVNSATLTITAPPSSASGYLFRLQVVRGGDTLTTLPSQLKLPLARIYVDASRLNMTATGADWTTAFGSLDDALRASAPGSVIWVASGTYRPTSGSDTNVAFQIPAGVSVYGGFSSGMSSLGQRNPAVHPTILSGKLSGATDRFQYSRNVVMNQGAMNRATTLLDGFILEDSYSSLLVNDGASPTIRNCVFHDNQSIQGFGAAISNINGANPLIAECQFLGNTADYGGALYVTGASATVENSVFAHNNALGSGGAIYVNSGSLSLIHCTVADNTSQGTVAALLAQDSTVTVANSIFWNNKTNYAGWTTYDRAIRVFGGSLTFANSCVEGGASLPATNLTVDPIFSPSQGVDYALARYSPLVNAGSASYTVSSSTDIAGNPRVHESAPDIGAYELQSNALAPVLLTSLPRSRVAYNIGGSVDFTVSWPSGTTLDPAWTLYLGTTPLDPSRYTVIEGNGFSTVRVKDISLADAGLKVTFTDNARGVDSIPPAVLTVKEPRVVRVNPAATGNNDGTSWENAYTDLATALSNAQTADEIWVAAGTYTPASNSSFNINLAVTLLGGFSGTETTRDERDPAAHPTIFHAAGSNPALNGVTPTIDPDGMTTTVDGFIVENTTGPVAVRNSGVSITYRECLFRNNAGYVGNYQSEADFDRCEFTGNTGYMFFSDRSVVTLDGCTIHDNTTSADLMHFYNNSTAVFSDTVVTGNTVVGALIRNSGGPDGNSLLTVLRSTFRGNTTGGAVIDNSSVGTCRIESSLFARNTASSAYATVQNSGTLAVILSTFADNSGGWFGGGLATYPESTTTINSSIFWGNRGANPSATVEQQQVGDGSGALTVTHSIIEKLATYTATDDHNTPYYPFFANPSAGDYHLLANSPAIDNAEEHLVLTSALDLDKALRPLFYGDMGAYEFIGTPGTPMLISTYPSSVTTAETTTVGITIQSQPFSGYRWQYFDGTDWVDVTNTSAIQVINSINSDTSTLQFNSPTLALNGTHYRLILTIGSLTYTTGDFVLTVNRPRVLYVNGAVSASGDGSSWATAFKTVQQALAASDENAEIWVQAGTYAVSTENLKWNTHLYGGFAGNETERSQRDWTANVTTLTGNGQPVFSSNDPIGQKTSHAVLDGFTITGAPARTAIFLANSDAAISNCTFRGNKSAIDVSGHSNPVITNCVFDSHTFTVLVFAGDTETVSGCTFTNNIDSSSGASGSTVYIYQGKVTITDSAFTGNTSSGGIVVASGDFDATSSANVAAGKVPQLTMSRCSLTGNTAYGGILLTQVLLNLDNSLIARNTLTGSALWGFTKCVFNLTNLTVADNTGTFDCAGIQCDGRWNLTNSIVWGNRTSWPYGSLVNPGSPSLVEDVQIKRGITTVIKNSTIEGAYYTIYGSNTNANSGYDPMFADAAAGNYQLSDISPAVNAGTAAGIPSGTLDIASQPRLADAAPDMGAYEFTGTPGAAVRVSSNLGATKVIVGQGTQFTVQVPAGVNVQWQVNTGGSFVNVVSGGNQVLSSGGKTLTLSNASLAMNGYQYRYVLSGAESYTSAPGVLTVAPKPIVYVDAHATGNRDGTSWADAFVSLDDALTAAVAGRPCEVWVAQGTYVSGQYSVPPAVELYGGFAGGETARSERDISAHPVILTSPAGSDTRSYLLSDGYPDTAQNGIVIDGFTLSGASSGIEISTGPAFVRNCTFTSLAGDGVAAFYVPVTVEDCVFAQPGVEAVLAGPGSTTTIRRSDFQAGLTAASADQYLANVTVEDSVFHDNTPAGNIDTTIYVSAGSTVNMTRCRVLRNHGDDAIQNDGTLLIRQSLIADNFCAGIDMTYRSTSTRLTSVTVADNASWGIGIGWQNMSLRLTNCIIAGNNFRQQIYTDSGGVFASYTLVQGETYSGTGNQSWDPLFTNPAAGDYTLSARSPAINAGDATALNDGETDIVGNARIQAGATDLGAYESANAANPLYRSALPTSATTTRGVDGVFSIKGASSYTYTWQYFNGSEWVDITFNSETNSWEGPAGVPVNITTVNGVSTLTVPSPALGASGLQFRVTIDGQGVTSDPFTLTVSEPEILYVDASVAASGDGKTWGTAFKTLDEAIAQVIPSRRVIYVAAGTYKPASSAGYRIQQRMEIYGGFPAGGAAFAARDAAANRVILSGELGDPGSTEDNAYPLVGIMGNVWPVIGGIIQGAFPIGADTILDGVTVDSGKTGISVEDGAAPTLRNVIASHNAGSGLGISWAGGRVENCQFLENSGGGASAVSSPVTFSGCAFRGNIGAGLLMLNGSVRMENIVVSGNKSDSEGGGIVVQSGTHYLVNSTVVGNYAGGTSGGGGGGGLYVYQGNLVVRNSIVWANRSIQTSPYSQLQYSIEKQQLSTYPFGAGFNVQNSDIEGLYQYGGSGNNVSMEPLFYATIEAASAPTTTGDFHLYGGSSLVDTGNDALLDGLAVDADGAPRPVRTVDIGAYEVQGAAGDPLQITQQPADLIYEEGGTGNEYHVQLPGSDYAYQWESSTDGSVFTPVADGTDFAGSQTATLQVLAASPTQEGTVFRVRVTSPAGGSVVSRSALFSFYPSHYFVNAAAADDSGDGYTWATAFKTLGTALEQARIHPSGSVQIWVAGGTYSPSESDTAVSFPVKSNVEIYGGFAGTETYLEQRDIAAHPTVLQGIAGSAAVFATTGTAAITGARIDGFAINTATAGISLNQNVTLTVANCAFSGLETGIAGNSSNTVTVQNCQFTGLSTAGVANHGGTTSVADSVFTGNALGIWQGSGSLNVVRSAFRGNGVPTVEGGGVKLTTVRATIEDCLFSGNYSLSGSGLYATNEYVTVRNCTFAGNYAGFAAGFYYAIYSGAGTFQITNSILWGNNISGSNVQYSQYYYENSYSSTRQFYNNDIQRLPGSYTDVDFTSANGNISVDPLFAAPVTASAAATTGGDYRLTSLSSSVINKGSNAYLGSSTIDLAQSSRVVDTTVDLGAYEFPSALVAVTSQPTGVTAGIDRETAVYSAASNSLEASYQWQVSTDGGNTWVDLVESATESGVTTATLAVVGTGDYEGRLYRVKVTSPDTSEHPGVAFSNAAAYHFAIVNVAPLSGVRNATLTGTTSTLSFTVPGGALPASILDGAFAVHAMQTGRLSLADGSLTGLAVNGETVSMQSAVPFKAGELVEVTTTKAIQRADGYYSIPLVYQFRAANLGSISGFFPATSAIAGASSATALASGDVDENGSVDLVIGGTNGATVWLNNGAASFTATGQTLGSGAVSKVFLGSLGFAGSHRLDIVLLKSTGDVEIWRNEGDGTFTNTSTITGVSATSLGLADLNGDGALDLFIATAGADQVWFNDGAGAFTDSAQRLGTGAGVSVAFGDYNNNNSLDVFTANGSGDIEIWSNDGAGHFTAGPAPTGSAANRVIAADLDKDGRLDLVAVRATGPLRIYRQSSSGAFNFTTQTAPVGSSVVDPTALSVGDLDGDGFPDLVFGYASSSGAIQVWRGQGYSSSNDTMNFQQVTDQPTFVLSKAAELADLNGDGRMDAVFISASGVPTVALYVAAPTAPTGLTATAISDTQILLAWTDNATTETGYTVERSPNGSSGWTVISSSLPANSTSYTDTGLSPATRYYYRVRSNIGGVVPSAYSNTANALTAAAVTAVADAIAVLESGTATTLVGGASSVLANDTNPAAGTLAAAVVAPPARGALSLNSDGTFSYTPSAGYYGDDSFTYRATNLATGATATATVAITVTRLNDAPNSLALTPIAGTHYTGQPAGEAVATLSATDPDPEDAGLLTFSLVSGEGSSGNADFTIVGSTLKTAAAIDASAGLTRSIRVRVTDSMGLFREQAFTVAFTRAPTAAPGSYGFDEDTPYEVHLSGTGGVDALGYEIVSQPSHGTLTLGADASTYLYTPDANFNGTDSFTYRVLDSALGSEPVTVTLNVDPVDDPPELDAIAPVTTVENTPVTFTLVGHDPDGDAITSYQLVGASTLGSVQIDGAQVTYTPNTGVIGAETLSFTATAGGLTSAPLSVAVTITPEPVALTVYRGLYEYSDIPASSGDWSGVLPANISTPAHGTVTLEGSRLRYEHNGDAATSDSFTYTLTNGSGAIRHVDVQVALSDRVLDVTSANDSGPDTLRAAIDVTNRFAADTLAPDHTVAPDWLVRILPAAGTFTALTTATNEGSALGFYSYLRIAGHVTIDAAAVPGYILNGGGTHRARHFLVLSGASLTLKHLVLNNGEASDRALSPALSYGGAVLNFGTFIAEDVDFNNSRAAVGAAIYNDGGTLSLTDSRFAGNYILWTSDPGGIVVSRNGTTSLTRVTFAGSNTGQGGENLSVTGDGALATISVTDSTLGAFHLATANGGTLNVTGLPYAVADTVTRPAGQPVTIALATLLANDSGGPFASVSADSVSAQGVTITRNGDNLIYAAPAGLATSDTFTYTVTTAAGLTSTATVTVTIAADPYPHGNADTVATYRGVSELIDVLANDTDDNGGTLSIAAVGTPAHGTATIEDGRIRYVNDDSDSATDTFTYNVSNGSHITENVTVTLTIADRVLDATSSADSGAGTLRAALAIANRYTDAGTPQWTIRILAGSDKTWTPTGVTIDLYPDYGTVFKIAGNVLIDATASPNFTLSGPQSYPNYGRLFLVQPGATLALKNLTLANSQAVGSDPSAVSQGGAVLNRGTFSATGVTFRNNTAVRGAALFNDGGDATLTDCVFTGNVSPYNSSTIVLGIVVSMEATLTIHNVTIDGYNSAPALFVWDGTFNHSGENHIASYQPFGSVNVVPGAPAAANDAVSHTAGKLLRIPLATLFANDTNAATAAFTFAATSTNGVAITRSGDSLVYNAPANRVGDDSFTYTLTDSIGSSSTATVAVQELDPTPALAVAPRDGGGVVLTLKGEANTPYQFEISDDLAHWNEIYVEEPAFGNDWAGVKEIYTDGDGNATFEDPTQPDTGAVRFYRAKEFHY